MKNSESKSNSESNQVEPTSSKYKVMTPDDIVSLITEYLRFPERSRFSKLELVFYSKEPLSYDGLRVVIDNKKTETNQSNQ